MVLGAGGILTNLLRPPAVTASLRFVEASSGVKVSNLRWVSACSNGFSHSFDQSSRVVPYPVLENDLNVLDVRDS
jgi:hypothetical protein